MGFWWANLGSVRRFLGRRPEGRRAGTGFGLGGAGGLFLVQLVKRDLELAPEVALVAGQLGKGVVPTGIVVKGPGEGVGFAVTLESLVRGGDLQAKFDQAGFHGAEAAAVPHSGGDAIDQIFLEGTNGLKVVVVTLDEEGEAFGVFAGVGVLFGGHTVDEAVSAGFGFACFGARSCRLLGVAPVGVDLCLRSHRCVGGRVCPTS